MAHGDPSLDLGFTQFYVDNTDKQIGSVNLNPLGQGGDFIAFPVVGDVGYFVPAGQAASFSKVEIANILKSGECNYYVARFSMPYSW